MDFIVESKKIETNSSVIKGINKIIDQKKIRKDFAIPLEIARLQKEIEMLLKEQVVLTEEICDLNRLANKNPYASEHGKIKDPKTE